MTRLFIVLFTGVEGGFETDEKKYEVEEINSIVVLPEWTEITLPNPDLPGEVCYTACYLTLSVFFIFVINHTHATG